MTSPLTSDTMVLWNVSLLYSQPSRQLTAGCPSSGAAELLWFRDEEQESSGWPLGPVRRLKFTEFVRPSKGPKERHKWGGTAPVNTDTSMWNARKIWGTQIHTYKIFWNFPKPPMLLRISSKFIPAATENCALLELIWSNSAGPEELEADKGRELGGRPTLVTKGESYSLW